MADLHRAASMTPKGSRRIGSSADSQTPFDPEKLMPKDVQQFVQQAVRLSVDSSPVSSAHEALIEQLKDANLKDDDQTGLYDSPTDEKQFDLQPPTTNIHNNAAAICTKLFSREHLQLILLDRTFCARFAAFLQKYKPEYTPVLRRYQATQKAKKAVDYANAIAQNLPYLNREPVGGDLTAAASFDDIFQSRSTTAESMLVENALPAFITYRLVSIVTDNLVKEITGQNIPLMKDMIDNIAEVYCLTDPSQPDNPIIYASEEFYHTTQYGVDYVCGRNCRFLNGPETLPASRKRVGEAIREGKEVCETILNYRRDGTPFLNLLMISPLYDNKGRVRYFIGCQIDITNLLDQGRSIDSFQHLLAKEQAERGFGDAIKERSSLALGELGHMLDADEIDLLKSSMAGSGTESPAPSFRSRHNAVRRHLGGEQLEERNLWPLRHLGPTLPGVYQNYLLVRPYPSLRITFTSPSLRIPGMAQSRLMSRIGGPESVREGILEALQEGISVTAKVSWIAGCGSHDDTGRPAVGKPRWIHCTPLLGADHRVGVWMIVLVEQEEITGSLNVHQQSRQLGPRLSIIGNGHARPPSISSGSPAKMYAHYLRGMKPLPSEPPPQPPSRKDSTRIRTMEGARNFDSGTLVHDAR